MMTEINENQTATPPTDTKAAFHKIFSVTRAQQDNFFKVKCEITDTFGVRYVTDYVSAPGDTFGLAPIVRAGIFRWIADGNAISLYLPPTDEERRVAMPSLTPRQLRLGLVNSGFSIASVQSVIDAIGDATTREKAQIEWEFASSYARIHPLITQITAALAINDDEVDTMWAAAEFL